MRVMIDLETLGTAPGSAILSIGAVAFDPVFGSNPAFPPFYANIEPESCAAFGLTSDPRTVKWWEGQSDEAKAALLVDRLDLPAAIRAFADWWSKVEGKEVWSFGANFDVVLWEEAIRRVTDVLRPRFEAVPPWSYRNVRCARTVMALAGVVAENTGTKHNALHDAMAQAEAVSKAYEKLGLGVDPRYVPYRPPTPSLTGTGVQGIAALSAGVSILQHDAEERN